MKGQPEGLEEENLQESKTQKVKGKSMIVDRKQVYIAQITIVIVLNQSQVRAQLYPRTKINLTT
jgi:hypothetical protein